MGHGCGWRGAVPMLLTGQYPDYIAGMNFLYGTALPLSPAAAGYDEQGLAKRVGMPGSSSARLKGHDGAGNTSLAASLELLINSHRSSKPIGRAFRGRL